MRILYAVPLTATLAVLLASNPLAIRDEAYSVFNDDWDGVRHLFGAERLSLVLPILTHDERPVYLLHGSIGDLDPRTDAYLAVGPSRVYPRSHVDALRAFLEQGGRALVADDRGTGRDLVEDLDVGLQIPGVGVYTPAYSKTPDFPVALSTGALPALPAEVVLNQPSVVLGNGTVLLESHEVSWLDQNDNRRPDLGEPRGTYPFAQVVPVGQGELLVVGDSSLFIREMAEVDAEAVEALLDWLAGDGRTLVVDAAHRAPADPVGMNPVLAGEASTGLQIFAASTGVLAVAAWSLGFRLRRRAPPARRPLWLEPQRTRLERAVLAELEP